MIQWHKLVLKTEQIIIMNNREWIEEQKRKLVQIDRQERRVERVEARWDTEYPTSRRTVQNLIDNTRRFKKQG